MNLPSLRIRSGIVGAALILLPAVVLMILEIQQAISWNFYPSSNDRVINLTKDNHIWDVSLHLQNGNTIEKRSALPFSGFGDLPANLNRLVFSSTVEVPRTQQSGAALHVGYIFAKRFVVFIDGERTFTEKELQYDLNIPLPNKNKVDIRIEMDVAGVSNPGFDLRSQTLVGDRVVLEDVMAKIKEYDHSTVLWMVIPRLIIGILFALGSLIFAYGIEYQLFGAFSLISGLKMAATYGEMGLYFPHIIGTGTLVNSLNLVSAGLLLMFVAYFFRRKNLWTNRIGFFLLALGPANLAIAKLWNIEPDLFLPAFYGGTIVQQSICVFGSILAYQTFNFLRSTKRSYPRQIISMVLAATFLVAIPFLSYITISSNIFWLGGGIFELVFIMIVASCVSTDIGGVRAERDVIRRKLGMFVDEGKVTDIIQAQGVEKEWRDDVSVMFIDIRNYCVMNDVFGPHAIYDAVSDYYQAVIATVYKHGGIVDKFIGDGVLAVWGIEDSDENSTEQCIKAAISLRSEIRELNTKRLNEGKFQFSVGIGIHSGKVAYGLIGTDERAELTVIGSTVNVAARIEKQTKSVQSDILISEATYELLKSKIIACPRGRTTIVEQLSETQLYQPIAFIENNQLLINDPIYEKLGLEAKAGLIDRAPTNLILYNYTEFIRQATG